MIMSKTKPVPGAADGRIMRLAYVGDIIRSGTGLNLPSSLAKIVNESLNDSVSGMTTEPSVLTRRCVGTQRITRDSREWLWQRLTGVEKQQMRALDKQFNITLEGLWKPTRKKD
jgi:hypothetical protein